MAKQHTTIILRNTTLLEVSASLHFKNEKDVKRKDILYLKEHSNNITSISQKDDIVSVSIWFDSKEKADEFIKRMDKLTKSN